MNTNLTQAKINFETYQEICQEQRDAKAQEYRQFVDACTYTVIMDGTSFPVQTLEEAKQLADEAKSQGVDAQIELPNGEFYIEEIAQTKEVTKVQILNLKKGARAKEFFNRVFSLDSEFPLTWVCAARLFQLCLYSGRILPESRFKYEAMTVTKLIAVVDGLANALTQANGDNENVAIAFLNKTHVGYPKCQVTSIHGCNL